MYMHRLRWYIRHIVSAVNTGGHGVHSPHLFDFIQNLVMEKHPYYCFEPIENLRKELLNNTRALEVPDIETGTQRTRTIRNIALRRLKPSSRAQLLFRMCEHYKMRHILELGTSLGITTLYLSAANKNIRCISIEESPSTAQQTRELLEKAGRANAEVVTIDIDSQLPLVLKEAGTQDLIFIGANHRYETLLKYFEHCINFIHSNSIIVVDDPYCTEGMTRAWSDIRRHPDVKATIDLYHMGIVFFNPEFACRHYRVRI